MNVIENTAFALRVRGISMVDRTAQALKWLERVGLSGMRDRGIDQVSGGEAQRVQLARALIADFPLLLLDEPFSSLDLALKRDLQALLKKLVVETQVACLLVSHDPEDKAFADACTVLEKGKVIKSG